MKRLHVNLSVANLDASVRFYSRLFAAEPSLLKPDYARWMLDDPRVNFAISTRQAGSGIDHLGIQTENEEELSNLQTRIRNIDEPTLDEGEVTCCYARSTKQWIQDPEGLAWEIFLNHGETADYAHPSAELNTDSAARRCC